MHMVYKLCNVCPTVYYEPALRVPKTKFIVVGSEVRDEDGIPMNMNSNEFEHVNEFPYLGSVNA